MGLLDKLRVAYDRQVGPRPIGRAGAPATPVVERPGPAFAPRGGRLSNGLKDFLWHLEGVGHGNLLDSGPVWQATVGFFVERGFKVYADDLLSSWKEFLRAEEDRLRALPLGEPAAETSPAERAEHFLCENLQYPADTFHAMLIWDLLDYL